MRPGPLGWALLGLALFLLPFLLLGPGAYITLDDNLDAELAVPALLARTGTALDYHARTVLPQLMQGLPRNALRPGLSLTVACFEVLPPLPAYLVNMALVRLAGLLSMWLLLRGWLLRAPRYRPLAAALALAWAVLPVYSMYGVSVLGQPAVLAAVQRLSRPGRVWWPWLVLLGFALWSSLVLAGVFVLVGLAAWRLLADWHQRRLHLRAWAGLAVLTAAYAVVEYPLLAAVLGRQFVPHRVAFNLLRLLPSTLLSQVRATVQYGLLGQYHSGWFFRGVLLLSMGLAVWFARRRPVSMARRVLPGLLVVLAGLAVFGGFNPAVLKLVQPVLPALRTFNLTRFHFLTPLLWWVGWALALRSLPAGRWVLVAAQLAVGLLQNREWVLNLRLLAGHPVATEPTYRQMVAPPLFARVAAALHRRTGQPPAAYRVACLGLPPAVAQLNGFYTLDSYQNNYPLAYKQRFRPLIAGELDKDAALRTYFDAWGNRCYLLAAELGKNFRVGGGQHAPIRDFAFDAAAFRALGGRFVLSAVALARPSRSGLQLVGRFTEPGAYWHLFVYEAGPLPAAGTAGIPRQLPAAKAGLTPENP